MAAYRLNIPSDGGTYTAATLNAGCQLDSQIQMTPDAGFSAIVTQGHYTFDGTNIILTASTNGASSQREGYMEVIYQIGGSECKKYIHLVQEAPPAPKATLTLSNGTTAVVPCDGDSTLKYTDMTGVVDLSQVVSVHVESCVTKIGERAFNANSFTSLTSITMADSVTEIGESVHETSYGSTILKTITFSSNLVSIGDGAFWGCGKLTSINLLNGLQTIGNDSFRNCSGLTTVVLPDSVKSIGDQCFYDCKNITTFTFGTGFTGVTSFGQSLQGTDALTRVTCKAVNPPVIDDFMFCSGPITQQCYDKVRIYVPRNSVSAYEQANGWSSYYIDNDGF